MQQLEVIGGEESLLARARKVFDRLDVTESTRADYKYRIGLFLCFVAERGFNRDSFLEFKRELAGRADYSISTKNKYLAAAKIFLKELNRQGYTQSDITQNIKCFAQTKRHKKEGLNDGEIRALIERVKALPSNAPNARLRAILSLLILQGLRQIEIVRMDAQDLDFPARAAFIRGKGRDDKERIDLHPETVRALRDYMKLNKVASGPLFTSRKSNNPNSRRLTTRGVQKIVKAFLGLLGIEKDVHGFRHYFTSKLIRAYRGDLLEVARYTRHKSMEMLQVYNDNIKRQDDLPRFYATFEDIKIVEE